MSKLRRDNCNSGISTYWMRIERRARKKLAGVFLKGLFLMAVLVLGSCLRQLFMNRRDLGSNGEHTPHFIFRLAKVSFARLALVVVTGT